MNNRASLPFPHRSAPTERRRGLAADEGLLRPFDGYEPFSSQGAPVHRSRLAHHQHTGVAP